MIKFLTELHKKASQDSVRNSSRNSSRGFTILETLIAITILVFAITGPLSLVAASIRGSGFAKDSITAFYLAQEGVEYIRNTRDINAINETKAPSRWLDNIESDDSLSYNCMNDYGSEANKCSLQQDAGVYKLTQCDPADCSFLPFSATVGTLPFGDESSTEDGHFIRNIWLEKVPDPDVEGSSSSEFQVIVNVLIKWKIGSVDNQFLLREYLTNWKAGA